MIGELMTRSVTKLSPAATLFALSFFVASARAATEPPDPCSLLTPAQVGGALGATYAAPLKSVAPRPNANAVTGTDCRYNGKNQLWFRIYFDGSSSDATTLFAKLKMFYGPNTPASGIGDEAYFDKQGALHARKGNVRFYLTEATDNEQAALTKLGEVVAGQL
jgi:hypothetical protein